MKSIKPGRGPSGMSFIGSIFAIIFGIFWTIFAAVLTAGAPFPLVGIIFPLFGVMFVAMGIAQAIYNYKNATGKNRYSLFDITDSNEESDPAEKWIKDNFNDDETKSNQTFSSNNYCPYCGENLESEYKFCPKCGKSVK